MTTIVQICLYDCLVMQLGICLLFDFNQA